MDGDSATPLHSRYRGTALQSRGGVASVLRWYILDNPQLMQGRRVLDVGSGSGACAIAAMKSGALNVTANDIDPVAATAIKMNAALNAVNIDVCKKNLVGESCDKWNCILLGDMVYDAEFTAQLLKWLRAFRCQRRLILLGDPGRQALRDIEDNCLTKVATYCLPKSACLENRGFTQACVWRFM
ncbi:hypothetical protein B7P43_G07479 [Cryptotermes secundus]|uniref:ETFB lysine methyltransferase n=1 Tax=Cryptotermes secundus TaxID=105785 RepID=A0A2J7PI13_9NEOP|nr:hypothetical protein B7P43_G07479 [Cryptotermes secundus]